MTKTLLVNCYLKGEIRKSLLDALKKFSAVEVTRFSDIDANYSLNSNVDCVVISGSEARIVKASDRAKFEGVAHLIKTCGTPVLGICYGHQLLCHTLGGKVGSLVKPVFDRFEQVRVVAADEIFHGFKEQQPVPLSESHYDYVLKESLNAAGMVLLADSASCEVEAVKHKNKPFYGVQFHPERVTIEGEAHNEGHIVVENFFRNVVKR